VVADGRQIVSRWQPDCKHTGRDAAEGVLFFRWVGVVFWCGSGADSGPISGARFRTQNGGRFPAPITNVSIMVSPGSRSGSGKWHPNRVRFPAPKSQKKGTCRVAVVQLLCSPGGCRQGTAPVSVGPLVPTHADGVYRYFRLCGLVVDSE